MVLHAPETAATVRQLNGLQPHVVDGEHHRAGWKLFDVVAMHRDCLEHRRLLPVHWMSTSRFGQSDSAGKAEFAPERIAAHPSAERRDRHLHAPAAAEARHAIIKDGARELNLPLDVGTAV